MTRYTLFLAVLVGFALVGSLFLPHDTVRAQGLEINIFAPEIVTDAGAQSRLETELGIRFNGIKWFCDFATPFDAQLASRFSASGPPELTWEPVKNGQGIPLSTIANGAYDSYLISFAQGVKNFNKPIRINLAAEMNGDWALWGLAQNGNTKESFINMWRHVVDLFRQQNVTNVDWVWSPNVHYGGETFGSYSTYYPGDNYVDYTGLDGYNWGTSNGSQWQSFSEVFSASYTELTSLSDKPILIMETASAEVGGDKGAWIRDMFAKLSSDYPRIVGITWFHMNKETDWRINSSNNAKNAFVESAKAIQFSSPINPTSTPKTPTPQSSSTPIPTVTSQSTLTPSPTPQSTEFGRPRSRRQFRPWWRYRKFYVLRDLFPYPRHRSEETEIG